MHTSSLLFTDEEHLNFNFDIQPPAQHTVCRSSYEYVNAAEKLVECIFYLVIKVFILF